MKKRNISVIVDYGRNDFILKRDKYRGVTSDATTSSSLTSMSSIEDFSHKQPYSSFERTDGRTEGRMDGGTDGHDLLKRCDLRKNL